MSRIANRRELAESVQALVKTNAPDAVHYNRVLDALGAVATDDIGVAMRAAIFPKSIATRTTGDENNG